MKIEVICNLLHEVYPVFTAYIMRMAGIYEIVELHPFVYTSFQKFHRVLPYYHIIISAMYQQQVAL